jgi:hypothetical protein
MATKVNVIRNSSGQWEVKSGVNTRAEFKQKLDAIKTARSLTSPSRELVIHNKNGQIIQQIKNIRPSVHLTRLKRAIELLHTGVAGLDKNALAVKSGSVVGKTASKKPVSKVVTKTASKKPVSKVVTKTASKKPVSKVVTKTASKKPVAKAAAKKQVESPDTKLSITQRNME